MPETQSRRLAAILAADVAGYSALMEADEARTVRDLKDALAAVEPIVASFDGHIFGSTGDGFLSVFPSIVSAMECAVAIQSKVCERSSGIEADQRLEFRIGVNLGDVLYDGERIYGDGVNVAARLQALAEPGSICVAGAVYEEVRRRLDLTFEDLGEQKFKNISHPVHTFRLVSPKATPRGADRVRDAERGASGAKPSIAVLPFTNMSNDPEQEYFSEGITEDLITELSKVSGLHVVPRNTIFTFKGKSLRVRELARQLDVDFVLIGSVRKAGSRVRVTSQLIDGEHGEHQWADRYDRDLTDIFAIQDEITAAIVHQLKVKLLPDERRSSSLSRTGNIEAYAYYLRGRQFLHRRSKSFLLLAKRMFAKAVELDGRFARAHAGIADCDSFLRLHYGADVSIDDILAASATALGLEPRLAEAHASRGLALSLLGRYPEAMEAFQIAIDLDPNQYEAHYFCARACFSQGKLEEAAQYFYRAARINPDDCQALLVLPGVLRSLGREREMLQAAREGIARAERELARHPENPRPAYLGAVGLAVLGETDRAKEWAARALVIDPEDVLTQYNVACFCSLAGEHDRAVDLLLDLLPRSGRQTKEWVRHDSDLDPIRRHPKFGEVMQLLT